MQQVRRGAFARSAQTRGRIRSAGRWKGGQKLTEKNENRINFLQEDNLF